MMKLRFIKKYFINNKGVTLIELTVTLAIMSILAAGIMPLTKVSYKRTKEIELHQNLRIIRNALDHYKQLADEKIIPTDAFSSGYPENLEILVTGVNLQGPVPFKKKFLRRIPKDPMTEDGLWGFRSYADDHDSNIWGGQDVYDIYSQSDEQALDESYYKEW